MTKKKEESQELVLPVLRSTVNLEYYVSPQYARKFKFFPIERDDYVGGRTVHEPKPHHDKLTEWLQENSLCRLTEAYPGAYNYPTYLFSGSEGLVAVDTYLREEGTKDMHALYRYFVRLRIPKTSILSWDLSQTIKVLGYEQQQPTEEFKQRCPQFFK